MKINTNKITTFLNKENKSKEWLSGELPCSVDTIKRLLKGEVPGTITMVALSELMGCTVNDLFQPEYKKAPRGR